MFRSFLLLALLWLGTVCGFYGEKSPVVSLTPVDFDSKVVASDELWLVEFFAPWCGHCKRLAPEWEKAAKELAKKHPDIHIAAVDADAHRDLGSRYGVQGFPTIKVFGFDKKAPGEYRGGRSAEEIIAEAKTQHTRFQKSKELGKEAPEEPRAKPGNGKSDTSFYEGSDVIQLTDESFEAEVINGKMAWLVEFYAPWCGHCKNLIPDWKQAATELLGVIKMGAVDATVATKLAEKYHIQGFPTIKFFAPGSESPEDYNGGRSANDIVAYGRTKGELFPGEPPKVNQISSQEQLENECFNKLLCVVFIVPHVADTGANGRNMLISTFVEVASKLRARPVAFGWVVGGDNTAFEEAFGISVNYPSWIALNEKKGLYGTHKGRFEAEPITQQIKKILDGRVGISKIGKAGIPKLESGVELWDGKDYEPPAED